MMRLVQITDAPGIVNLMPTWSPDGQSIAFVQYSDERGYEVYVAAADGSGTPRRVIAAGPLSH